MYIDYITFNPTYEISQFLCYFIYLYFLHIICCFTKFVSFVSQYRTRACAGLWDFDYIKVLIISTFI